MLNPDLFSKLTKNPLLTLNLKDVRKIYIPHDVINRTYLPTVKKTQFYRYDGSESHIYNFTPA